MDFKQYNPRSTGNAFGKVRYNQLQFLAAIEELQKEAEEIRPLVDALKKEVNELKAEIKALKAIKKQVKETK